MIITDELNSNFVDIYIDESGDLGFSSASSDYFVMAALIPHDSLPIQRCFRKIRQHKMKKKMRDVPKFKYNNTPQEIKRRIFQCISSCNADIAVSLLRKRQVRPHLHDAHQIVYNYLAASLVSKITTCYANPEPLNVIIDKSLYGLQKERFDDYLTYRMMDFPDNGIAHKSQIQIRHVDSCSEPCIQAVDFIAGAVHAKYRSHDTTHYDMIYKNIILEIDYPKDHERNEK